MKKRFLLVILTAALALSLVLGACAQADSKDAGDMTFVLVPKNLGNPYFDTSNKGAQEAAGELGVPVLY